jgi:SAM-dependent methyltransferase
VDGEWTNERAIRQWGAMPRAVLAEMAVDGDFAKRHLINPTVLRMLGELGGRHVLDAGCGNGYLSRMLADAMRACVRVLKPGGVFVFTTNHPCFEQLGRAWREHGEYRVRRYLAEYEIPGPSGVDFHRSLSTYLNQVIRLGCHLIEVAEPGLTPEAAAGGPDGVDSYVHLPNFLVVAARKPD